MQDEHTVTRNGPILSPTCLTCTPTQSINSLECSSPFATTSFQHLACPGCIRLQWEKKPQTVLIIKKQHDKRASQYMNKVIRYLITNHHCTILIEETEFNDEELECLREYKSQVIAYPSSTIEEENKSDTKRNNYSNNNNSTNHNNNNTSNSNNTDNNNQHSIDLVISLGGDGTVLHTVMKFCNKKVPPLIAFNLGTFNFLANFEIEQYEEHLNEVFSNNSFVSIRMRLKCTLGKQQQHCIRNNSNDIMDDTKCRMEDQNEEEEEVYHVMNDIVIDRGPSPFLTRLDCYCCNTLITTVQADGLIIATPTGSTAYSMSAGGSIVHPMVHSLLFTPISPHSLSFRPLIFPGGTILNVNVPLEARSTAWLSCDGQRRRELKRGEYVKVEMSEFPVPLICKSNETAEWFLNLTKCLGWNVRTVQRPL